LPQKLTVTAVHVRKGTSSIYTWTGIDVTLSPIDTAAMLEVYYVQNIVRTLH